jgi:tetratricopeptide (TPR) repeat protein
LKTVTQELGVARVLEGTLQKAGDRVRVNVQLVDARADTHLWAKNYDRELKDVFGVQSEVAQQIADALRAKLSPIEATALAVAPTRDPEAYDLFLQGEYEMRQGESALTSPEPFYRAARFYREALSRDPNFALAAARLAHSRLARHWYVAPFTAAELEEVKRIVDRALALAPDLAEAHVSLGLFYYWGHREYDAALAEFQRALEFQPNNAMARGFLATFIAGRASGSVP